MWVPDATALADFRRCPESFRLRHRLGLRPPKTLQNAAEAGSAFHVGLDVWFAEPTSHVDRALAALRAAWGPESLLEVARPLALMERTLTAYAERWPRERDPFTVVRNESYVEGLIEAEGCGGSAANESEDSHGMVGVGAHGASGDDRTRDPQSHAEPVGSKALMPGASGDGAQRPRDSQSASVGTTGSARAPSASGVAAGRSEEPHPTIRNVDHLAVPLNAGEADPTSPFTPFAYGGIIDRKIRLPDGTEYIMDTKSTGSYLNDGFFQMLRLSDQLIGYVALERALGRRCDGFYIDAVHVSESTPRKTLPFVREGPILVPEWRVRRWAADVRWTLDEIARLETVRGLDQPWPIHHNWAFGKPDGFWDFFEQPIELHPALRAGFEEEPWNPRQVAERRLAAKLLAKIS